VSLGPPATQASRCGHASLWVNAGQGRWCVRGTMPAYSSRRLTSHIADIEICNRSQARHCALSERQECGATNPVKSTKLSKRVHPFRKTRTPCYPQGQAAVIHGVRRAAA
jgi:hypothetical protein